MKKDLQLASNSELLASLLGIAPEKLEHIDLSKILSAPGAIDGIGEKRSEKIYVVKEVVRRIMEDSEPLPPIIHGPEDVYRYLRPRFIHETKEHFALVLLNTKNLIIATPTVSIGSLTASVVHPREVFEEAIKYHSASIILVHNHPSGDPSPSREDVAVTTRLVKAGEVMDIPVLDHIIIGSHSFTSLKERDLIK